MHLDLSLHRWTDPDTHGGGRRSGTYYVGFLMGRSGLPPKSLRRWASRTTVLSRSSWSIHRKRGVFEDPNSGTWTFENTLKRRKIIRFLDLDTRGHQELSVRFSTSLQHNHRFYYEVLHYET